jgi:hypothetical protein
MAGFGNIGGLLGGLGGGGGGGLGSGLGGSGSNSAGVLKWVIQQGNSLAAVKQAGPALLNLKNSIQGVPFGLNIPGMSSLQSGLGMLQGLMSMAGMLTSGGGGGGGGGGGNAPAPSTVIAQVFPELQPIIKKIKAKTVTAEEIMSVLDPGAAFAAGLANPALVVTGAISNASNGEIINADTIRSALFLGANMEDIQDDVDAVLANTAIALGNTFPTTENS